MSLRKFSGATALLCMLAVAQASAGVEDEQWTDDYQWLVVVGAFAALAAAFGIGANDVANAFATSVGAKSISLHQAVVLAGIFEFGGAVLLGSQVTKTVRKGIADASCFEDNPSLLMWGMLCVLLSVGIWLMLATHLSMPVSTTHSCVGGIVGMTVVLKGADCVTWYEYKDDFPFVGGVSGIVLSWVVAPFISLCFAAVLFVLVRHFVLRSTDSYNRGFRFYPILVFVTMFVLSLFIVFKGAKGKGVADYLGDTDLEQDLWASLIAACVALVSVGVMLPMMPKLRQKIDAEHADKMAAATAAKAEAGAGRGKERRCSLESTAANAETGAGGGEEGRRCSLESHVFLDLPTMAVPLQIIRKTTTNPTNTNTSTNTNTNTSTDDKKAAVVSSAVVVPTPATASTDGKPKVTLLKNISSRLDEKEKDIHTLSEYTQGIHANAEVFDEKTEMLFKYVQVFTACCDAFAHGANDVANSMGPFAAIYTIYNAGVVSEKNEMGNDAYWILGLGGLGIVIGLAVYGYKIVQVCGTKLAKITPSRGFSIELGAVAAVILGSRCGIPLSTTHCQVGATCGVAMLEGKSGIGFKSLKVVIFGWIATLVFAGGTAALFSAMGAFAPTAYTAAYDGMPNELSSAIANAGE